MNNDWDRLDAVTGLPKSCDTKTPRESLISVLGKIVVNESIPSGTLYAISPRKQVLGLNGYEPESVEEWAKRCFYIVNID